MSWMITCTGRDHHFAGHNLFDVDPEANWLIREIAHSLAQINRFTGHASRPYSVAEHSLLVADLALGEQASASVQLAALLHDAHEAYTGDVSSPVKWRIGEAWKSFEHAQEVPLQNALRVRAAAHSARAQITHWDLVALATERRDLLLYDPQHNQPWQVLDNPTQRVLPSNTHKLNSQERQAMAWHEWRDEFVRHFNELSRQVRVDLQKAMK